MPDSSRCRRIPLRQLHGRDGRVSQLPAKTDKHDREQSLPELAALVQWDYLCHYTIHPPKKGRLVVLVEGERLTSPARASA